VAEEGGRSLGSDALAIAKKMAFSTARVRGRWSASSREDDGEQVGMTTSSAP